jgi:hypothetical protein
MGNTGCSYAGGSFPPSDDGALPDWYGELTDEQLATLQPPGRSNRAMVSNDMKGLPALRGTGAKL